MKYLLALFLGILLTLGVVAFVLRDKFSFQVLQVSPSPSSSSVSPSPSIVATPIPVSTKTVSGGGLLSFPKFTLTVPTSWTDTKETPNPEIVKLVLSNGGYSISILEGGFGGAICLFPGDADVEGPSARYTTFADITTKSGDLLRRVTPTGGSGFGVCDKTQYGWGEPTIYGAISISAPTSPDPAMLSVVDGILSSITKQ